MFSDIKCLKVVMTDKSKDLAPECISMFKKRIEMYRNADAVTNIPPLLVFVLKPPFIFVVGGSRKS